MKRLIAFAVAVVLCLGLFAGCGDNTNNETTIGAGTTAAPETTANVDTGLADAMAYVKSMYKNAAEVTSKDYQVIGVVPMGTDSYAIEWSVDVAEDIVSLVKEENGMVTVNVNEDSTEEVAYVLTATITGSDGTVETLSWNHILPATMDVDGLTYAEIVDLAYTVESGVTLEDAYRLYGTVTCIDTPWSEDYQNITVTIAVDGREDMPIMCYRLCGEGAADLALGDKITVEGYFTNYNGTIEFAKNCVLVGYGEYPDQAALLKAAFAIGEGASMDYPCVMKGVITEIPTAWSEDYQNITVNIDVDGQIVQAYRLSGEGAKDLAVGDTVTVAGVITNYKGTIEFGSGCKLIPNDAYTSAKNALSGYKLQEGESQEGTKTITGTVVSVDSAWSEDYQNITVTIQVAGLENYKIQCYRLSGEGAKDLAEGSVITVTGTLTNYKGTIEFAQGCTIVG